MNELATLDRAWMRAHPLPMPGDGGKEERGRVLAVGGEIALAGAVLLAGAAALRAGAGKLQLAVAADAAVAVAVSVAMPEARVFAMPQTPDGRPAAGAAQILAEPIGRCDALLVGPGMMNDEEGLARALLGLASQRRVVLDAGALDALADAPPRTGGLVLTPHSGEMARLLDRDKAEIEADPLAAAREAAQKFGAAIVMKGARTHVAAPDGAAGLYAGGGVGLGVSGSGDVLGGVIAGLLARGVAPFEAAAWGVFLHGEAGARLSKSVGTLGFLAREIAGEIPAVMAGLE
jgi:ADP-dependent NAD(P)H-hydrate dehydratase